MSVAGAHPLAASARPRRLGLVRVVVGLGTVVAGGFSALLAHRGLAGIALAAVATVAVGYVLLRRPLAVVAVWLAVTPFVVATDSGTLRMVYWAVHRALPVLALLVVVVASLVRLAPRGLPTLGWPELAMGGYLLVSVLSILHTSPTVMSSAYDLYDRVFIPMCLYLLVRLLEPEEDDLRRVVPLLVVLVIGQALIGVVSWSAPDLLPSAWQSRLGERTTGSLRHANVYGTTLLFAGGLLLHRAHDHRPGTPRRWLLAALFLVALVMVFMTYSRASWLAGIVVVVGLVLVHRSFVGRVVIVGMVTAVLLLTSGVLSQQIDTARDRFSSSESEESALSRLPVVYASLRMVEQRPVTGWGFGNFDRYSPEFQGSVGTLYVPDRIHASHNLYLTVMAEQGVLGLALYLAPALWWLVRSGRAARRMPGSGLVSRELLVILWLVLAAHVIVNTYSNMRVVFGLGIWWLTLGTIASLVRRSETPFPTETSSPAAPRRAGPLPLVPARMGGGA